MQGPTCTRLPRRRLPKGHPSPLPVRCPYASCVSAVAADWVGHIVVYIHRSSGVWEPILNSSALESETDTPWSPTCVIGSSTSPSSSRARTSVATAQIRTPPPGGCPAQLAPLHERVRALTYTLSVSGLFSKT